MLKSSRGNNTVAPHIDASVDLVRQDKPLFRQEGDPKSLRSAPSNHVANRIATSKPAPVPNAGVGPAKSFDGVGPQKRPLDRKQRRAPKASVSGPLPQATVPVAVQVPAPAQRTLVPMHAAPQHQNVDDTDLHAQAKLAAWARRHVNGLSATAKAAVFGIWTGGAGGQSTNAAPTLEGMGEVAFPFTVAITIGAFHEVYATSSDARNARQDYLAAHVMMIDQERLKTTLEQQQDPKHASLLELVKSNIQLLNTFTAAFEKAYYRDTLRPLAARARADVLKQAKVMGKLQGEMRDIEAEIDRLDAQRRNTGTPPESLAGLDQAMDRLYLQHQQLSAVIEQVQADALQLLSTSTMRERAEDALQEAKTALSEARSKLPATRTINDPREEAFEALDSEIARLEREIREIKQDLADLNRPFHKRMFEPFSGLGPNEIKLIRSLRWNLPKAFADAGTGTSALLVALDVLDLALAPVGFSMASALLNLGVGRLDTKDAKNDKASASAGKLSAVNQAMRSAQLFEACLESEDPATRSLQYVAWAHMRSMGRSLHDKHHATKMSHSRATKGTGTTIGATLSMGLGTAAMAAAVPQVVIPGAALLAVVGAGYYSTVAVRNAKVHIAKDKLKARAAVADTFICLYGPQGIEEFAMDMASGNAHKWDARLQEMAALAALHNPDLPAMYLQPAALLENEFLSIERMSHQLHLRARDRGTDGPDAMATLAKEMAAEAKKPNPAAIKIAPGETLADHKDRLRLAVCELFIVKDYEDERLPLVRQDLPAPDLLLGLNDELDELLGTQPIFQARLQQWTTELAADPDAFGRKLDELGTEGLALFRRKLGELRQALASQLIGPNELRMAQQLIAQGTTPLKGPLSHPGAAFVLELLADPTWMEPVAPPPPSSLVVPPRTVGPAPLLKAIKSAGREQNVGPARNPKPPKHKRMKMPTPHPQPQQVLRSIGKGSKKTGSFLEDRAHSLKKHFTQKLPNPLATPEQAVEALEKAKGEKLTALATSILQALLLEVYGFEMPEDATVMQGHGLASTDDLVIKVVHCIDLLEKQQQDAAAAGKVLRTGTDIGTTPQGKKDANASKSRKYLQRRFDSTETLCKTLIAYLQKGLDTYIDEQERGNGNLAYHQDPRRMLRAFDSIHLVEQAA